MAGAPRDSAFGSGADRLADCATLRCRSSLSAVLPIIATTQEPFVNLADILELVAESPVVTLGDGESVLVEGERSAALYVLVSGELEVQLRGRAIVRIAEPGAIVGEIGLLLDQPATADVVAVGQVDVHRIDGSEELFVRYPEFMGFLATMLAQRLSQVSRYLSDLQEQFAGSSATLGLVPTVLRELLESPAGDIDVGSEREPDSPY
jgi:CRP/FNR family cyclic AMP-dependent transcriptional regulator